MQKKWLLCTTLFNIHASKILVNGHEYVIFARKILSLTWKKTTRRKIIRKSTKIREKKGQRAFMHKYKQLYKKILHHHKPANQSIVHSILLKRTSVHFILHQILFTIVFLFCLSFFSFCWMLHLLEEKSLVLHGQCCSQYCSGQIQKADMVCSFYVWSCSVVVQCFTIHLHTFFDINAIYTCLPTSLCLCMYS